MRLWVVRLASGVRHSLLPQILAQLFGDIARFVVAQQTRTMADLDLPDAARQLWPQLPARIIHE